MLRAGRADTDLATFHGKSFGSNFVHYMHGSIPWILKGVSES